MARDSERKQQYAKERPRSASREGGPQTPIIQTHMKTEPTRWIRSGVVLVGIEVQVVVRIGGRGREERYVDDVLQDRVG